MSQMINAGMSVLSEVQRMVQNVQGSTDLVSYTKVARVEPLTLIDADLAYYEGMTDIMQSVLSLFSGYYLQAAALSMDVQRVAVVKQLERLNTSRSVGLDYNVGVNNGKVDFNVQLAAENYKDRLPVQGDPRNYERRSVGMEASAAGEAVESVRSNANLALGKLINVEVTVTTGEAVEGKPAPTKTISIPISIRLMANMVPTASMLHILSAGSTKDTSLSARIDLWDSGAISFWRDLVFCQDLIDEHKKHLLEDKDGFYSAMIKRSRENAAAAALKGPSLNNASNIIIIGTDTQAKVELKYGGQLRNFQIRQKLFDKTYLMLLVVVDKERSRVTIYHRGIPESTSVSLRDLKVANKGSGPDIADVLAAYRLGNSPTL